VSFRADPLERELRRSRRFGRPLSLVRVRALDGDARPLASTLRAIAREVDHVATLGDNVLVLLPETDGAAARAFVDRASRSVGQAQAANATVASFPNDGLTLSALIAAVNGHAPASVDAPPVQAPAPVRWADLLPDSSAGRLVRVGGGPTRDVERREVG
jgi:hypothetical protein